MRVLFTGASSFTGFWIVKALAAAGHKVGCPLRGAVESYEGVRRQRVELLKPLTRLLGPAPFGTPAFLEILDAAEPWDLLCHHAAEVRNYKQPDFDPFGALGNNTSHLCEVLAAFRKRGGKAVVLTGTVFEPDEGKGSQPLRAFSPYGLSKGLTWQVFRYYCAAAGVALGKFVIPNPFGPYEEPRFTAYLMREWKQGKTALVKAPDYIRDNIPADLLAETYVQFAERAAAGGEALSNLNPSCYAESQGAFASRVAREVGRRLGWSCEIELVRQQDFNEPLVRTNREPAAALVPTWNESRFWDSFAYYYLNPA